MSLNRRQFLKNAGIGSAAMVGGASLLKTNSAFAAYPAPAKSDISFIGATLTGGTAPAQTFSYTSQYVSSNSALTGRRGLIYDVLMPFQSRIAAGIGSKTIVIKPNLVYASGSGAQAVLNATHVDALKGLIDFIRAMPGFSTTPIIIAESSASSSAPTNSMMNWCGYLPLLTAYSGITLVDLNTNKTVDSTGALSSSTTTYTPVQNMIWGKDLKTAVGVNAAPIWTSSNYYIISIARPKTHNCAVMTGVTKNCAMSMPLYTTTTAVTTNSKSYMHGQGNSGQGTTTGEDETLMWNLFQNTTQYTLYGHPDLAILDAWEGQQHNGPVSGTSMMQGCAVAGFDHVAVDRICAKLMGFSDTAVMKQASPATVHSYTDPRYLVWLSNAGIGNYDLSKINIVNSGTTMANIESYIQTYQLHDNYMNSPYYEVSWLAADSLGPNGLSVAGSSNQFPPSSTSVLKGAKPYMSPQANMHVDGVVRDNRVKIDLFLPAAFPINLTIYNLKGERIRRLGNETLNHGRYSITWDCRDESGNRVPNGNYIIKLTSNSLQCSDRVTLVR